MKKTGLLILAITVLIMTNGCGISKTMQRYEVEYIDRPEVIEQTDNTKAYSNLEYIYLEGYQSWFLQTRKSIAPRCELFVYQDPDRSSLISHMETSVYGEAFIDLGSSPPKTIFVTLKEKNRLESEVSVFSRS